jgi:hypothetical protein
MGREGGEETCPEKRGETTLDLGKWEWDDLVCWVVSAGATRRVPTSEHH